MAAFTFDALYFSLLVFLSAAIPGIAIGWPLLKKSGLGALEKFLLSFFLGLFAVPSLLFLESLAGLKFSLFLVFANAFVLVAAGAFWGVKNEAFSPNFPKIGKIGVHLLTYERIAAFLAPALLLLAVLLAFWLRIQPFSPIYSELDPYFYVYGTGQIIREGIQPLTDDSAWWPEINSTHIGQPLKKYLEAEWFALYTNGGEYNNYLLFTTSSWLPPISAAFVSFGAYLLVSSIYGRRYGLLAAFLLALLPITIYKMSAGVNEASPVGMMMLFVSLGVFAQALVKKEQPLRIFSSFAFFSTVAGSTFSSVLALPFAALAILQSIDYFVRGKANYDFVETCAYAFAGFFISSVLQAVYAQNINLVLSGPLMMAFSGLAAAAATYYAIERFKFKQDRRIAIVAACAFAAALLFFFTPVGGFVKNNFLSYLGAVEFKTALERTIAEQNLAGESFEGEAGLLALVPKNHIVENASGPGIFANLFYSALSVASAAFTLLGNLLFRSFDVTFNFLAGIHQTTSTKEDSVLFIFLMVSLSGLALRHFSRSGEEREVPSVMIFLLAFMLPVLYVGANKIKFTVFAGVAIALAAAIAFAELEKLARWLAKRMKMVQPEIYISAAFAFLLAATIYAHAAGPIPYGAIFMIKSFQPRYQDNPVTMTMVAAKLCEDLRAKGVPYNQIQSLCDAGAYANFSDSINNQFDSNLCWLSQMSIEELFPANGTDSERRTSEAITSAKFRCNRLGDYWVDSMEWMGKNLDSSDRVTSWWDYGHWTNYFADKKTVLRNEHSSRGMIGRVAHDYIVGSPSDLADSMNYFDSRYALFDVELIGGSTFGGKYGALNYLGCVHEGSTSLDEQPGTSDCEYAHSPERIAIPRRQTSANTCVISESQQRTGVYAYRLGKETTDQSSPSYCIGETTIATGEKVSATYYLDRKDENGDLMVSKGFIRPVDEQNEVVYAEMVYNNQKVWFGKNGTLVDSMEDAKTDFYRSNLYRGFYLEDLPGFDLVYKNRNGEIKIYRMKDFTGNKEGYIDPEESQREN
jgi:asparagine N-glycosylation enzyme membrane subunit Stt3